MERGKKWTAVFNALTDYAHSQENCEAMTNAVLRALADVIPPKRGHLRGSDHPAAKLTEVQAAEIKRRTVGLTAEWGWRQMRAELAQEYGVSIHTIDRVAKGEGWKHI